MIFIFIIIFIIVFFISKSFTKGFFDKIDAKEAAAKEATEQKYRDMFGIHK